MMIDAKTAASKGERWTVLAMPDATVMRNVVSVDDVKREVVFFPLDERGRYIVDGDEVKCRTSIAKRLEIDTVRRVVRVWQ